MLSTILFIDENPVGYQIKKHQDTLLFKPTQFTAKGCCPLEFTVMMVNGSWQVAPEIEPAIRQQVLHDINMLKAGNLLL